MHFGFCRESEASRRDLLRIVRRFQRREGHRKELRPAGTIEIGGLQSSLRDLRPADAKPGVETPGYYRLSLRDDRTSHCNLCKTETRPSTSRPLRGAAGTRPKRRSALAKPLFAGGASLTTRMESPSARQSRTAPESRSNCRRNSFGTTVWPLVVMVLVTMGTSIVGFWISSLK